MCTYDLMSYPVYKMEEVWFGECGGSARAARVSLSTLRLREGARIVSFVDTWRLSKSDFCPKLLYTRYIIHDQYYVVSPPELFFSSAYMPCDVVVGLKMLLFTAWSEESLEPEASISCCCTAATVVVVNWYLVYTI